VSQINTRDLVLLGPTALTTNGTGPDINLIQGWQAAIVSVVTSTTSGTSPTFAVYIQKKIAQPASTDLSGAIPTGTAIYDDVMSFTSITTNSTRIMQGCTGPLTPTANATTATTADWAQSDAALTGGSIRIGPIGGLWRVKYVVGGTSPATTLAVTVQLIPFGT
jgi:hypothetical protein